MIRIIACNVVMSLSVMLAAQTFISPVGEDWLKTANEIIIEPVSGSSVTGKTRSVSTAGSQIKSISIKDAAGTKHEFKASEITLLKYKMSKIAKMQQVVKTASQSIENAVNTNYAALASDGYAVWENVKSEDGKNVYMLQVLNPWFCNHMKVYPEPSMVTASYGGKQVGIGDEVLVVKDKKTYDITERKYRKEGFALLFGDCPEMMSSVVEKERDWDDLPEHVKMYEDCKNR